MQSVKHSENINQELRHQFAKIFGGASNENDISTYFCPGRVNLIGDYTDFTGGFVFPCAIDRGTQLLIRRSNNTTFRFASTNDAYIGTLSREQTADNSVTEWLKYPAGVINAFHLLGFDIDGLDLLFAGNIPSGAGLSSSASIEVVTAFALNTLFHCELTTMDLVKLCQRAENEFVGTQSGIMDQFAVAFGQNDHALYLDCHSLDYKAIPMNLGSISFVIAHTGQVRENSESAYNDRVNDCNQALSMLQTVLPIEHLGSLNYELLEQHHSIFDAAPIVAKRVQHIVNENDRVHNAVAALNSRDFHEFGRLMNASHASLRDLFEVSSTGLEHMIRLSREQPGVLGCRLTGAGFGGCTINLVQSAHVQDFIKNVGLLYSQVTSIKPEFYTFQPGDGARQIQS